MTRHAEWEPRLAATVQDWQGRVHEPCNGRDCAAFVLACIEAVTGEALRLPLRRYRTVQGQGRALLALGYADLQAAADGLLGARIAPLWAQRGDVVTDGAVLGVMLAGGGVAFGESGMAVIRRPDIVAAWPVGRAAWAG
jgi:hypothetical protein